MLHRRRPLRGLERASQGAGIEHRDQPFGNHDRTAVADAGHHRVQAIETAFQQGNILSFELQTVFGRRFKQGFHGVAEFADRHDAGHARAALERMQIALQTADDLALVRVFAQRHQQLVGMIQQVASFLDEDIDELGIEIGHLQIGIRIHDGRTGQQPCDDGRFSLRRCDRLEYRLVALRIGGFGKQAFRFQPFRFAALRLQAHASQPLLFDTDEVAHFLFAQRRFGTPGFDALDFDALGFDTFCFEVFRLGTLCFDAFCFKTFRLGSFCFEAFRFGAFCGKTFRVNALCF